MTQAVKVQDHDTTDVAVPQSESAAIFSIIERAARDPNVDLDKMERLMAMREREMNRIAETAFNAAMKAAQSEMPQVVRDADNDQTRSRYARYETISEAIQPVVAKHGFSLTFSEGTPAKENCIRVVCDVMHDAGHTKQYYADVPFDNVGMKGNANKTNTHAYGSTKSYGKRYLKCDIFDVAVKNLDDDGNAAGREPEPTITEEQEMQLREMIDASEAPMDKFLAMGKLQKLSDLKAVNFNAAMDTLKARLAKRAGK